MAIKPESNFIAKIHKRLPAAIYRMKTNNPYVAGIPDCYYSGSVGELWVEYKFVPKIPINGMVKVALSALQRQWLEGREVEGRNVGVVVGSPEGVVIFHGAAYPEEMSAAHFRIAMIDIEEVAEWITEQTT
jgi:hypothetical protein